MRALTTVPWRRWMMIVLAVAASGCLEPGVTRCASGRICGSDRVCDELLDRCVYATPCASADDGAPCEAIGISGACRAGACVAPSCGNQQVDRGETCDDGELRSHDGCSSQCQLEIPTWTARTPVTFPTPRWSHAMTYDAARGRVVLFGGSRGGQPLGDTWEWDGASWLARTPAVSPTPRYSHGLAYDAARERVVLFGGLASTGLAVGDTWEWDGTTWTERASAVAPPARQGAALAFDAARGRVVLFGGFGTDLLDDTWEWDGTSWAMRATAVAPPARYDHALAFDAARARVVLFGGTTPDAKLDDTWEWDGTAWVDRAPASSPLRRGGHAMAYDAARARVVMYGGVNGPSYDDAWEWTGATWTELDTPRPPSAREGHAIAYDAVRRGVVMFSGPASVADTWELRFAAAGEPPETCIADLDADGDGRAGCDDPDCWAACTPSCPPATSCDPAAPRCGDGTCNPALELGLCTADCS